jgi:hypothetical protein
MAVRYVSGEIFKQSASPIIARPFHNTQHMYHMQEQPLQMKRGADDLLKALAIVNIFETGKPFGEFAACVVLNDGAGISYGICQFTHRSGSLLAVVEKYLDSGGSVGRAVIEKALPQLSQSEPVVIRSVAANEQLKKALRAAAVTREMREAQLHVAFTRYLQPAIDACNGSGFVLPLSLAVVFDSITHGSYEKIRDRVRVTASAVPSPAQGTPKGVTLTEEKAWITEYVRKRDAWLASIPRLTSTRYRTRFFLNQIKLGRWELELPLNVNGFRLDQQHIENIRAYADEFLSLAIEPESSSLETNTLDEHPPTPASVPADKPQARSPIEIWDTAIAGFDHADRILATASGRSDRAKSLWTTVIGSISQALWAVFGFLAGIPREVWLVVALIAAALMLAYLYRQIELGKIRETK